MIVFKVRQTDVGKLVRKLLKISPENKINRRIYKKLDWLLEELNSKYPHDRLYLVKNKQSEVFTSFLVCNEAGESVIKVGMVSSDDFTTKEYNKRSRFHTGSVEALLEHTEDFLREYHQYHIAGWHHLQAIAH